MSRTHHVTKNGTRPHRNRAPTRLINVQPGHYWPYEQRPKNVGTSRKPGGGYAKDREEHALEKKLGKRRQRRRLNRLVNEGT